MRRNAAIYLRISQDPKRDGLAVERQRTDCEQLAERNGWHVTGVYTDSMSASDRRKQRPEYDRLVADYTAGKFDALVCWDLDRLTRQPRQLEDWIERAEERGLVIVTANGEADLSTDGGRMYARIKASVARAEIERKGARHRRANEQRVEQGRPVPSRRRYGYETDGITPRPDEAAIVRRLFDHVVAGGSLRSIQRALIAEGVVPTTGRSWNVRRLAEMIRNPFYAGYVKHLDEVVKSDVVVPIVPEETAATARAIIADPSRRTSPVGTKPKHLLSGLLVCGVCGDRLFYMRGYVCRESTGHAHIAKHIIEPYVLDHVADALLAVGPDGVSSAPVAANVRELVDKHGRNADAVAATMADRDEGLITPAAARTRLLQLRDEREAVEADLERLRGERSAVGALATLAHELLGDAVTMSTGDYAERRAAVLARFAELDIERQREVVRTLIDVEVHKGRGTGRVHVWHKFAEHLNPDAVDPEW